MNKIFIPAIFFTSLLFIISYSFSQGTGSGCLTEYLNPQYTVSGDTNIVYGNAPDFQGNDTDLFMDVFQPVGDTANLSPLIIFIHGGGFIDGNKSTLWSICDSFSRRGYVTASISYRLGFNREHNSLVGMYGYPYAYDVLEMPRAIHRSVQDVKAAIRYLKGSASIYGIDTSRVFVAGESAGGFLALHTGYMNHEGEKFPSADSIESIKHYNLFNQIIFEADRLDLGSIEGTNNLNGTSSNVKAVMNIYGGLIDTALIESPDDPALWQYHVLDDPLVKCTIAKAFNITPNIIFPFNGIKQPLIHGACNIKTRLDNLNYCEDRNKTYIRPNTPPATPHNFNGERAFVVKSMSNFLDSLMCDSNLCGAVTTHLEELSSSIDWMLFPNPAQDKIHINHPNIPQENMTYKIIDLTGRIWLNGFGNLGNGLDISLLPSGNYIFLLEKGEKRWQKKWVKSPW